MYISLQDLLMIVGIVALALVAGFLAWTLYEAARLLRNVNVVTDIVRTNVERADQLVETVGDKLSDFSGYAGMAATKIGEVVLSHLADAAAGKPTSKKKGKKGMPSLSDLDEE